MPVRDIDDDVVLRARDIHKRFGRLEVLRGVDLDLRSGQILALVGENGAGKSTVVQCIARTVGSDAGTVELAGGVLADDAFDAAAKGVAVVWQDLALCDNLRVIDNLFLGEERRSGLFIDERGMVGEAHDLWERLHLPAVQLGQIVGTLSGGERQLVAIARAVRRRPAVLLLDEPTAALGVNESQIVEKLLGELRAQGTAILLVSHRLDQVFDLADRIAILRDGRMIAEVSPLEVHPDDVAALMSGIETDTTARRQLRRLHSLVDQLSGVDPGAGLPLIVSATAEALGVERICLHLLHNRPGDAPHLQRSATVGLGPELCAALDSLDVDDAGGPIGAAAATGQPVIVEDLRSDRRWDAFRVNDAERLRSSWSIPIVGSSAVLGTISGFADTVGRPQPDHLELVWLYASHAAAAIEREILLAEATRRNHMLETLRGVLDTLAGPEPAQGGMSVALLALCRGLGADSIALHHTSGDCAELLPAPLEPAAASRSTSRQLAAATEVVRSAGRLDRARPVGPDVLAVPVAAPGGGVVVTAWWADTERLSDDSLDLLDDAARSLALALEREALEQASAEADSLRRSQRLQRDFLFRLNHELRTPLTAIQGFASTLRQTDVSWDEQSQARFLDSIASESERMGRLVGDLLDFSAIDSGTLRLVPDWCDVGLVLEAARRCVNPEELIVIADCSKLPPIWGDHDRLEQVFVNLFENALRHGAGLTRVSVTARLDGDGACVVVAVADDGAGIPAELADRVFLPHERSSVAGPGAGLGLTIARGIVDAHGGRIALEPVSAGTTVSVVLPVESESALVGGDHHG